MLKICREQSPRKSMGFAELGLDTILAFKIFMLWSSEDHCKKYEDTQYSVTAPTPKALSQTFMPTTHRAIGFSDATGHILAPVGGLDWLCIGLSCKKTSSCFDGYWLNFAKVISSDCVYHISYL